jgi:hypothetical protein
MIELRRFGAEKRHLFVTTDGFVRLRDLFGARLWTPEQREAVAPERVRWVMEIVSAAQREGIWMAFFVRARFYEIEQVSKHQQPPNDSLELLWSAKEVDQEVFGRKGMFASCEALCKKGAELRDDQRWATIKELPFPWKFMGLFRWK